MSSLDFFLYFGYPRVKIFTRVLPAGKILYSYPYSRVKFHTHTLTRRVPAPAGKIDVPRVREGEGRATAQPTEDLVGRLFLSPQIVHRKLLAL